LKIRQGEIKRTKSIIENKEKVQINSTSSLSLLRLL
jgi:hypothetical protein